MSKRFVCDWCEYNFTYKSFDIFDIYMKGLGYCFCSLNCCVAQILKMNKFVKERVLLLYKFYHIDNSIEIIPSKSKNKLKKYGGKLDYSEFRKNFI
jgi:hypothetical protein